MKELAIRIASILDDYANNDMTPEHILQWVNQFEPDDREFILTELVNIFDKCYWTKAHCIESLKRYILKTSTDLGYANVPDFLSDTQFLRLQDPEKSQSEILTLIDEFLKDEYNIELKSCGKKPKYYLYLDDVLGTGTTVYSNLSKWLTAPNIIDISKTNYEYIKEKNIYVLLRFFCIHTWGRSNAEYRLIKEEGLDENVSKRLKWHCGYTAQNQIKDYNPKLNVMLPIEEGQPQEVMDYLNSLEGAMSHADRAFRKANEPANEELFSSPKNRKRLENIFLLKGVRILNSVKKQEVKQLRPLGYTIKSYKTFGLGTLFFTYRNIPNNCPIVFWWASNNWQPLFVLKNRGNKR